MGPKTLRHFYWAAAENNYGCEALAFFYYWFVQLALIKDVCFWTIGNYGEAAAFLNWATCVNKWVTIGNNYGHEAAIFFNYWCNCAGINKLWVSFDKCWELPPRSGRLLDLLVELVV